jgi:hypothetical protein
MSKHQSFTLTEAGFAIILQSTVNADSIWKFDCVL